MARRNNPQPDVTIDDEFAGLLIPHQPQELSRLRADIRSHGCLYPLIVWGPEKILLDGHSRLMICRQLGLPYSIKPIDLPDRAAARRWIVTQQLCRRNLSHYQRECLAHPGRHKLRYKPRAAAAYPVTEWNQVHKIKRVLKAPGSHAAALMAAGEIPVDQAYAEACA